ncbi:MAG: caspase family protein [Nitratireductor sp.]
MSGTNLGHKKLLETVKDFSTRIEADVARCSSMQAMQFRRSTGSTISPYRYGYCTRIRLRLRDHFAGTDTSPDGTLGVNQHRPYWMPNVITDPLDLPRTRSTSNSKGLARLEPAAEGTFIAFATQPDNVALDGKGRNSPFTSALLKNIDREGVEISAMMTDVRRDVYETTDQQQLPWTNSSLLGLFYFNPQKEVAAKEPAPASGDATSDARNQELKQLEQESADWTIAEKSGDAAIIRQFLEKYPNGVYARLARFSLERLTSTTANKAENQQLASLEKPADTRSQQESDPTPQVAAGDKEAEKELVRSIQSELSRVGCDAGKADGIWGRKSEQAVSRYAKHGGLKLTSLDPDESLLKTLQNDKGRICPLNCSAREVEKNGQCVAKTCESGFRLNNAGECVSAPVAAKKVPAQKRASPTKRTTTTKRSGGNCFKFNGQLICD